MSGIATREGALSTSEATVGLLERTSELALLEVSLNAVLKDRRGLAVLVSGEVCRLTVTGASEQIQCLRC